MEQDYYDKVGRKGNRVRGGGVLATMRTKGGDLGL